MKVRVQTKLTEIDIDIKWRILKQIYINLTWN